LFRHSCDLTESRRCRSLRAHHSGVKDCASHNERYNELDRLYPHLESMFAVRLQRLTISPVDIDESIQHALNEGLLRYSGNRLSLTDEGVPVIKEGRQSIMYEGEWMMRFLSRRNVVIVSFIMLVFVIITKLVVGLAVGNHAMITDGFENTTDLIIIGIISASLRTGRGRLGAIAFMAFMMGQFASQFLYYSIEPIGWKSIIVRLAKAERSEILNGHRCNHRLLYGSKALSV
jgi:hypothetical protein